MRNLDILHIIFMYGFDVLLSSYHLRAIIFFFMIILRSMLNCFLKNGLPLYILNLTKLQKWKFLNIRFLEIRDSPL